MIPARVPKPTQMGHVVPREDNPQEQGIFRRMMRSAGWVVSSVLDVFTGPAKERAKQQEIITKGEVAKEFMRSREQAAQRAHEIDMLHRKEEAEKRKQKQKEEEERKRMQEAAEKRKRKQEEDENRKRKQEEVEQRRKHEDERRLELQRAHDLELTKMNYDFLLKKLQLESALKQKNEGLAEKQRRVELKERGPIQESADFTSEEDLLPAYGIAMSEAPCSGNASTVECIADLCHDDRLLKMSATPSEKQITTFEVEEESADDSVDLRITAVLRLNRLQKEFGKFSYSVWKDELIVHLEDESARKNEIALRAALEGISKLFNDQKELPVKVFSQSLDAVLCTPSIGAKLQVNSLQQTTGMYVLHKGVVHWVSVAHHFLRPPHDVEDMPFEDVDPAVYATLEVASRRVRINFDNAELIANADPLVPSPMTYPCLKHMPLDNRGRRLLHSVDIMIGPVPMVAKRDVRYPESLESLRSVWKCGECNVIGCEHANAEMIYEIERVLQPTLYVGVRLEQYARYDPIMDPKYDGYKFVTAILPGRNVVHGQIEQAFADIYLNDQKYINVIYISSTNGVSPRRGDSGSIWVSKRSSEAVAITIGLASCGARGDLWVAVFLLPCLHVFCRQHKQSFADVRELQSIRGGVLVGSNDQ